MRHILIYIKCTVHLSRFQRAKKIFLYLRNLRFLPFPGRRGGARPTLAFQRPSLAHILPPAFCTFLEGEERGGRTYTYVLLRIWDSWKQKGGKTTCFHPQRTLPNAQTKTKFAFYKKGFFFLKKQAFFFYFSPPCSRIHP